MKFMKLKRISAGKQSGDSRFRKTFMPFMLSMI
jgi:hypothetical protein